MPNTLKSAILSFLDLSGPLLGYTSICPVFNIWQETSCGFNYAEKKLNTCWRHKPSDFPLPLSHSNVAVVIQYYEEAGMSFSAIDSRQLAVLFHENLPAATNRSQCQITDTCYKHHDGHPTISDVFAYSDCCLPCHSTASLSAKPSLVGCSASGGWKSWLNCKMVSKPACDKEQLQ
jgi:hypothetical protein